MLHVPGLYVSYSEGRGQGVFTAQQLSPDDIIELCPLILIPEAELPAIHNSMLHDYYFIWPGKEAAACIALGYGSLYNHHRQPNAEVIFDVPALQIVIRCISACAAGDELFIDYTGGIKNAPELWFNEF